MLKLRTAFQLRAINSSTRRLVVLGAVVACAMTAFAPAAAADVTIGGCLVVSDPIVTNRTTNCSGSNLTDQDLSGLDLYGSNFDKASLVRANFSHAFPYYSSFVGTDMTEANFTGASLHNSHISVDTLKKVNFTGASLRGAKISGAVDSDTSFKDTDLSGVVWPGITGKINLAEGSAPYANFSSGKLAGADFTHAYAPFVNLSHSQLQGTIFTGADLYYSDFSGAIATSADFTDANFVAAHLRDADLSGSTLTRVNFMSADLTNANMSNTTLTGANFDNSTAIPKWISRTVTTTNTPLTWTVPTTKGVKTTCSLASGTIFKPGSTTVPCTVKSLTNGTSGTGMFDVNLMKQTAGTLTLSRPTQDYGTKAPVTAAVSIGDPVPGVATFLIDGKAVSRQTVKAGKATFALPAKLTPGKHTVTATYLPTSDAYLAPRITAAVLTSRTASATTLTATGTTQPIRTTKPVRVTAAVTLTSKTAPAGKVSFKIDGKQWALVTITSGKAASSVPAASGVGRHTLTATFMPTTPTFQSASVSAARNLTVTAR